jgi:hypothetical protein
MRFNKGHLELKVVASQDDILTFSAFLRQLGPIAATILKPNDRDAGFHAFFFGSIHPVP